MQFKYITVPAAALGGFLGYITGGFDSFITALLIFVTADYITGTCAAAAEKRLSSKTGFIGILKKVCIFAVVCIANITDTCILGTGNAIRNTVIFFYIANEGISVLENAVKLGLPVPKKLKRLFEKIEQEEQGK